MLLVVIFILISLVLTAIPSTCATPLSSTQLTLDMNMRTNNDENNSSNNNIIIDNNEQSLAREMQSLSITDMLTLSNTTCPEDCPLCACTEQNFTNEQDELDCTLTKSIEACVSNSFTSCYTDILGDTSFDIEGICNVQCADSVLESERPKDLCQICNIFSCCTNCPSDKAAECFPLIIDEGYTPSGWTPLSCDISNGNDGRVGFIVGIGWTWMMFMMSVLFI